VPERLLVDLGADLHVTVSMLLAGGQAEIVSQALLEWPLDDDALEDLRWYLEDYLRAPFGVYEERGPAIQGRLPEWGRQVFASVFGSGSARNAYRWARDHGLELTFRSAEPGLLGLPWELMRDGSGPVALNLGGVSRSMPVTELSATTQVPGGRLRVMMVISRPAGTGDVGYRTIARPLLDRLELIRGEVELTVLRPPTLDALRDALMTAANAGEPFHVVHFDGHGGLRDGREGFLALEHRFGGSHRITASQFSTVLKEGRVPVVVLNACQSGAVGKELEAAVATALLREGTASVVAMAYSVYAVAAAEFMAAFYEALFAGETVSRAVKSGRKQMFRHDRRPSPKGELPLEDWLVPVHYMRSEVAFPQAGTARPDGEPSLSTELGKLRVATDRAAGAGELDSVGSFIGRDDQFYELESAVRSQRVVVLHGPAGTGKSELAKTFGRWWRDTGGVDQRDWVLWQSFKPGVASFGLASVITEIGFAAHGADFARLDTPRRLAAVKEVLARQRWLLIWDNFETVQSMPDRAGATPVLDDAGCQELRDFLDWLAGHGRSAVIITSRTGEDWLGPVHRIRVRRLTAGEAAEYATHLLAPYPAVAPRRARRAFAELLEWLDGHPLSMRLTLSRLGTTDPEILLADLQGTIALPGDDGPGADRTTSLAASITYSFAHLDEITHRLLPAVCLFHGVVVADVLVNFSRLEGVPQRFAGLSPQDWIGALENAAKVGLLTPGNFGTYEVHPALPGFLAAQWRAEEPGGYDVIRDAATRSLAVACALVSGWALMQIRGGDAGLGHAVLGRGRRTFGAMLGYCLDHEDWLRATVLFQALDDYWHARGLSAESEEWANRILHIIQGPDGSPPPAGSPAQDLWLFVASTHAAKQREARHLDEAERTYRQILAIDEARPQSPEVQANISVTYHQLGVIAQDRGELDEAQNWYLKSVTIKERLVTTEEEIGQRALLSNGYHQLGTIAQIRGRLDEAESWYIKSKTIREELGLRALLATTYYALGTVERARVLLDDVGYRARLDQAEYWCRKSLAISQELGYQSLVATNYHQLGTLASAKGQDQEAEDYYLRCLAISEELGDWPTAAHTYHNLGLVAEARGQVTQAEDWYRRSIAIWEELGVPHNSAQAYISLSRLAEDRGQPREALEWTIRCVTLFEQFPDPLAGSGSEDLARLAVRLGIRALEASWEEITGAPLPQHVHDYVIAWKPDAEQQEGPS
jgi:tetratricopeptide (TPR) repeat protein